MVALFHSFIAGKALDNFLALLEQFGILLFASVFLQFLQLFFGSFGVLAPRAAQGVVIEVVKNWTSS
jgi:hypothetical protein